MAANSFTKQLGDMIFSKVKRPGKYLLAALQYKLDKEFQKLYFEQMMYQGAFLSMCYKGHYDNNLNYEEIAKECDKMSIEEHRIWVNGEYIEQSFKMLKEMHKITRNIPVIYDPTSYSTSKALFDPNMFPIHTS